MIENSIDCRQMINPVNLANHFKSLFSNREFPNSVNISSNSVHLPSGLALTQKHIRKIVKIINSFIKST